MNLKTLILYIFVVWTSIVFTGCKISVNNWIKDVDKDWESLVIVTEKNKDKAIEITNTPVTIRNEVFWFEVELWEDRSWWTAHPNIRWYDFDSFSWWQYTFELDPMSQVIVFEFWEKNDFIEKELDPSNENDKERSRNHEYYELDWIHYKKIVSRRWEIPKYKWLGYEWDTVYWIFWENNRYYFSIHEISNNLIDEYFKNNSCYDKTFYNEIIEYSYDARVCPNTLTDIFNWWFKIFDVK